MIMSAVERERLKDELEKWNSGERFAFVAECVKALPYSQVKLINLICNDIITKKSNLNNMSTSISDQTNQYSNILEEQANDISNFIS